jgi:dipeptidyl-peptidase 4
MYKKALPILAIALFLIFFQGANPGKQEITLEDIWSKGTFRAKGISGLASMKDGLHYTSVQGNDNEVFIVRYDYKTGSAIDTIVKGSLLIPEGEKKPIEIEDYKFSPDENKILLATETEAIYRHSTKENNYIYDRKSKKLSLLSDAGKQMYADFSPDGNKVAFVRDNNLFYKDLVSNKEVQITKDGKQNSIINGATDWVYEEEFSFAKAFHWSPDGKKIAFYKFDESNVKEYFFPEFGKLYPVEYRYKYPKAGEANAIVSIHIYDLASANEKTVNTGTEKDQYIPRIKWTNSPLQLSLQRMNRHQNKLELMLADANTGSTKVIITEESQSYIDISDNLTFLKDGQNFIWSSEKDGFNHLYLYNLSGRLVKQITSGKWEVTDFKGIDEKTKMVYYMSTEVSATDRDLYSIHLDKGKKTKLTSGKGTNNVDFSEGYKYYINTFSDANTPYKVTLHTANGKQQKVLEDNESVIKKMVSFNFSKKEFFSFKNSEGIDLNAWMIKPPDFDPAKKYPVFMTVYGGPGINTVNNAWGGSDYLWHNMLAGKGYIVVSVDNRGTGARGEKFKKCTYMQLGKLETEDMIESAKYLGSLPYVDKSRIGIEGWSYGGYMAALAITKGADYFKSAISIAPVTNWRYYDSIYTERFLQTPQENPVGYDDNSPINFVSKLKGKYLLVHGTGDDNVHFQNSVEMITALVKANKQFDLFIYPDKNHGIYGGNTRLHLYTKMTTFIEENL